MNNQLKMGAIALTLATLMAGCTPVPGANTQAGATTGGDYAPYNNNSYGTTTASTDYGYGAAVPATTNTGTTANTSYYDYGAGTASTGSAYGSGTTTASTGNYYDYTASGSSSAGSYSNSAGGSYAVQVVASPNRGTADAMRSQMQSAGFNAVVDQVGGYYKVRIPFSSESEAKANLSRIRSSVPDAFYTVR
ncbi:MAG: SPOR domain-containing protein [Candidatus Thiothrix sulfatifontis]|nr:MAG: SPOR domain-containing protein [Candidatus Thiothrix sulfatifontis]